MKSVALIRTVRIDKNVERLENELKPFFGDNIFYVVDRYSEKDAPALKVEDKAVLVGRAFLQMRGLPWFPRIGWQCGDFMYYAAAGALPDYDFYWLIESDVSIRTDTKNFFESFNDFDTDFILPGFGRKWGGWLWYKSVSDLADGHVYGGLFPISRMSRRAALHLLRARADYSALPYVREQTWAAGRAQHYANDEAFTSTVLMRDGFSCQSLDSLIPKSMMKDFSLSYVVHPEELPFIRDRIVHPVCEGNTAKAKLRGILGNQDWTKLKTRMEEFSSRLGAERWEDFSGISEAVIKGEIKPPAAPSVSPPPLTPLVHTLNERLDALRPKVMYVEEPAQFIMTWLYQNKVAVLDFLIREQRIAFDLTLNSDGTQYRLEVLARDQGGFGLLAGINGQKVWPGRYLVGEWPGDLAREGQDQEVASRILDVIGQISNAEAQSMSAAM